MKPLRTAVFGAALTLAAASAFAMSGEAWYGTNRDTDRVIVTTPPPADSDSVIVYYDEPVAPAPVIVERDYVSSPPYDVVVAEPVHESDLFVVEPRSYPRIDHGLFPRKGPNDFGQ